MNPGERGRGGRVSLNALAAVPWKDGFTFPFGVPLGTSGLQQPRDPPAGGEMPSHGEGNGRTDIVFTSAWPFSTCLLFTLLVIVTALSGTLESAASRVHVIICFFLSGQVFDCLRDSMVNVYPQPGQSWRSLCWAHSVVLRMLPTRAADCLQRAQSPAVSWVPSRKAAGPASVRPWLPTARI